MCHSPVNAVTGRLFESATLGCCPAANRGYMKRREAMELARKYQPKKSQAALRLEVEVSRQLGRTVKFYTAVHSTLDYFHSVDAWFELDGRMVTIDVTTNPSKCSGKADVIVQADDFEDLVALARRIAGCFAPKPERRCGPQIRVWRAA